MFHFQIYSLSSFQSVSPKGFWTIWPRPVSWDSCWSSWWCYWVVRRTDSSLYCSCRGSLMRWGCWTRERWTITQRGWCLRGGACCSYPACARRSSHLWVWWGRSIEVGMALVVEWWCIFVRFWAFVRGAVSSCRASSFVWHLLIRWWCVGRAGLPWPWWSCSCDSYRLECAWSRWCRHFCFFIVRFLSWRWAGWSFFICFLRLLISRIPIWRRGCVLAFGWVCWRSSRFGLSIRVGRVGSGLSGDGLEKMRVDNFWGR